MTEDFSRRVANIASTYGTDTIFILGKGPSIDDVSVEIFANSMVIAVNDAERIAPADVTIFYADWVKAAINERGARSRLYITSTDFAPDRGEVVRAPYVPLSQDTTDLMVQRLLSDEFTIEDVLFYSALKVAKLVAQARSRKQTVYMVGFDFLPERGVSQAVRNDFSGANQGERLAKISAQEFFFVNALYALKDTDVDIVHVGDRVFSRITAQALNSRFSARKTRSPKQHNVAHASIVAELTTNHFGERHRLERMIRAAAGAGADFIKLQKRDVDTFYSQAQLKSPYVSPFGKTFGDYRYALELSRDDFEFVDSLCNELDIDWFASVLDEASFHFMLEFQPKMVKLPSTISQHTDYLSFVARNFLGGVVLSTGMTDTNYEKWVTGTFTNCEKLYLLQCNSAYPTPPDDCNVGVVRHYHELSNIDKRIVPGYSSHDFGWIASALAVAAGARMLEKHVKLGNTDWAHFDAVAVDLTTADFHDYVQKIREAELMVGTEVKQVNDSEHHKYFKAR